MSKGIDVAEGGGEEQAMQAQSGAPDVFVSYASQDAAVANAAVVALERQSLKCWIAPRDVTPGTLYADDIIRAINGVKVLVLVLSASSVASKHVGKEIERASSKGRPIVTLRIDAASLPPALEYFLSESQWIDLGTDGTEAAFAKLVTAVRGQMMPATGEARAARPTGYSFDRPPAIAGMSWMVVGALALLAAALAWFAYDKFGSARRAVSSDHTVAVGATAMPTPVTPPVAASFNPPPHSIAVLPFVNMSGDAKQEYFSDGITEELLNSLSRLNELQVVARTSAFSFKGQNVDVSTIAHKLNVGAILEGSVRRSGNTVRITAQLINAVTGFHTWSQTYDRSMTDILKVQTEVATAVAKQLEIQLVENAVARIELGGTRNAQAYDAYLRGMQQYYKQDAGETDYRAALAAFDQAISHDPKYAAAHARRAGALLRIYEFSKDTADRVSLHDQARVAAERAVALAPQFGEAHLALAFAFEFGMQDLPKAAREYNVALSLSPGSAWVQSNFGGFAYQMGHADAALRAARRAVSLDPKNIESHIRLAYALVLARRFHEALSALQDAKMFDPHSPSLEGMITYTLFASGQYQQVRQICESASTPLGDEDRHYYSALALHELGRQTDAEHELEKLRSLQGDSGAFSYAEIYARWGNKAAALQWLAKAEELKDAGMQELRVDRLLDSVRYEPEFKAIEARMNFPL